MPETILLIDDDPAIRALISDLVTDAGYRIAEVADGREAFDYLHTASDLPALILLNLSMPGMDGSTFRAAQQAIPCLAAIPIVLLSAADDLNRNAAALKVPEYLEKRSGQLTCLTWLSVIVSRPARAECAHVLLMLHRYLPATPPAGQTLLVMPALCILIGALLPYHGGETDSEWAGWER